MKRKICVYITEQAAARLAAAVEQRGATKSGLVRDALDRFLDATDECANQAPLERRLDWMSRQLEQLCRDLRIVNETVAMHARYHLAITPRLPQAAQQAACAIGAQRFEEFAAQVGRRVHLGRPLMRETLDRISVTSPQLFASEGQDAVPFGLEPRDQYPITQEPATPQDAMLLPRRSAATISFQSEAASRGTEPLTDRGARRSKPKPEPQISRSGWPDAGGRPIVNRPWRPNLILRIFLPFAAGFYLSYLFRTVSALIAGPLTLEFALSPGYLGLLTSAYFLTFAVAQLPVGVALDRYGPRRVQSVLLLLAACGAVLFATSTGFVSLFISRGLIGLGVAGALTAGLKATLLWFPKERVSLVNGAMVMFGALGAVTATTPSEWLLARIGWHGLFDGLAAITAGAAAVIYLSVPETTLRGVIPSDRPFASLRTIYRDPRFWRLAPIAATTIGTAWALQGLWAGPWLNDVEGLDRAGLVHHLLAMAVTLSLAALLLGISADWLRSSGVRPQTLFGIVAALFIVAQVALISQWRIPSYISWCAVAAVGAGTVLTYAAVAEYFPKELAGRANAALNVFHIGGAFLLQELTGVVIQRWPIRDGHYPLVAYQIAFAVNVVLQVAAWVWFGWPWFLTTATRIRCCYSAFGVRTAV